MALHVGIQASIVGVRHGGGGGGFLRFSILGTRCRDSVLFQMEDRLLVFVWISIYRKREKEKGYSIDGSKVAIHTTGMEFSLYVVSVLNHSGELHTVGKQILVLNDDETTCD